jgi:hypothetical protein
MKLIIAGGRDYQFTDADIALLDELRLSRFVAPIEEVVSGGASGVDKCGEEWARKHGIPVKRFCAEWEHFGKSAGPRRNRQMAGYADAVALFPGGRGTANMYKEAQRAGIEIYDFRKQ